MVCDTLATEIGAATGTSRDGFTPGVMKATLVNERLRHLLVRRVWPPPRCKGEGEPADPDCGESGARLLAIRLAQLGLHLGLAGLIACPFGNHRDEKGKGADPCENGDGGGSGRHGPQPCTFPRQRHHDAQNNREEEPHPYD